jgi:hypothetical protein
MDREGLARAVLTRPGDLVLRARLAIAWAEAEPGSPRAAEVLSESLAATHRASTVPACFDLVDAAFRELTASPALRAEGPALRRDHAAILLARGAPEAALSAIAPLAGASRDGTLAAASVALAASSPARALAWLDALPEAVGDPDATALSAMALVALGRPGAALARCEAALPAGEGHVDLLNAAGTAALLSGAPARALAHLAAARGLAPTRPDVLLNYASACHETGGHAAALGVLDGLVDLYGPTPRLDELRRTVLAALSEAPTGA